MRLRLSLIVEGEGDVEALPVLLRRMVPLFKPGQRFEILRPIRVNKSKLLRAGELERTVELAARKLESEGAILILVDADDDCPAEIGPELLLRARSARSDIPIRMVMAKREFEAWFLAAAASLRGERDLGSDLVAPETPEEIRGAKEWLSERMHDKRYSPTLDQPALAARMDLDQARNASSFDYLWRKVDELVETAAESLENYSG